MHLWKEKKIFLPKLEVEERIVKVLQSFGKVKPEAVNAKAHFQNDLALDSLDEVELLMAVEDEFCVEIPDLEAEKNSFSS